MPSTKHNSISTLTIRLRVDPAAGGRRDGFDGAGDVGEESREVVAFVVLAKSVIFEGVEPETKVPPEDVEGDELAGDVSEAIREQEGMGTEVLSQIDWLLPREPWLQICQVKVTGVP